MTSPDTVTTSDYVQLMQQGKMAEALAQLTHLRSEQPGDLMIARAYAQCALLLGNPEQALNAVCDGLSEHRHDAQLWMQLGTCFAHTKHPEHATLGFLTQFKKQPQLNSVYQIALQLAETGQWLAAATLLELQWSQVPTALRQKLDEPLIKAVAQLRLQCIARLRAQQIRQQQLALNTHLNDREQAHIDSFVQWLIAPTTYPFRDTRQRPSYQYFPWLRAQPWFEREEFDWVTAFEAQTDAIHAELRAVEQRHLLGSPYVDATIPNLPSNFARIANNEHWRAIHLWRGGVKQPEARYFPATLTALAALPLARAIAHAPEAFFSVLGPDTHIPPHYGLSNLKLVVHLPLHVPEHCSISVGGETRGWQRGCTRIFDDSYLHEAWNRSTEKRYVLITEVWHPDLSTGEKHAIEVLNQTLFLLNEAFA